MIFVSHSFDEVLRLATDVAVIDAGRLAVQAAPDVVSLSPAVRAIVGPDAIGSVLAGPVVRVDSAAGLAVLCIGDSELVVALPQAAVGEQRRVQIFARDVVLATVEPRHVSVRNRVQGVIAQIAPDVDCDLVFVDIGAGPPLVARITQQATRELGLEPGLRVWALVKAVSTRGHAY
jgi:molybdate transport system ATP-binding protein